MRENMDAYGSHLYLLENLIKSVNPLSILETGCGFNSTELFIKNKIKTISLEMQDQVWFERVKDRYTKIDFLDLRLMLGTTPAVKFIENSGNYDIIFIDGHGDNRWEQVNASFSHTNIIVTHDTEAMTYMWYKVNLPSGWFWVDFIEENPWTSILTNDLQLINSALEFKHKIYSDISNKDYLIKCIYR